MLDSTIRLSAMVRKYSSGEKKASTPSCSSRVPLLRKIHGMKATNPYRPGGHSACRLRILIRCSTRWRGVSTCPYIIVAEVGSPSRWAVRMTDSQRSASGFPGDMARRTPLSRISAPAPGSESRPASISRRSVVSSSSELMRAIWATSGAPRACSFSVG